MKPLYIGAIVVLAIGASILFVPKLYRGGDGVMCTAEAKLCPDGSYVGRTGPKCEFAPCPTDGIIPPPPPSTTSESGISGTVMLGPTCPVMRIPPDPQCADKPYEAMLALMLPDGSHILENFTSDVNGKFKISVAPGEYIIHSGTYPSPYPRCDGGGVIKVITGTYANVVVSCDTGIR